MEHNYTAEELQEILNRIMQGIMSIITSTVMCNMQPYFSRAYNIIVSIIIVCYIIGRIKFTLLNMWNWRNNKFNLLQLTQYIEYGKFRFPAIILFELCSYIIM